MIQVGPAFYNNVLPPIGLGLLAMTAAVPLLQWGAPPTPARRRLLAVCLAVSLVVVAVALVAGVRHPLLLAVVGLAALTVATLLAAWLHEAWQRQSRPRWHGLLGTLRNGRRKYAAYSIHLGFVCVAIGVTGSSLGTQRQEVTLAEGDTIRMGRPPDSLRAARATAVARQAGGRSGAGNCSRRFGTGRVAAGSASALAAK